MKGNTFHELAAILMLADGIGVVALKLRQPLIIGHIVAGILVGPAVLNWVSGGSGLKLLSSIGISVLLVLLGLKLDMGRIRSVGPVALATGLGQIVFTTLFGFLLALGLTVAQGLPVQYGGSEDLEFIASLPASSATLVVSTLLPFLDAAERAAELIVHDLVALRGQGPA